MRQIYDVADELIVHVETIFELFTIEQDIVELFTDLRLEAFDHLDKYVLLNLVPYNHNIHTTFFAPDKYTRDYHELDLADRFETESQIFMHQKIWVDKQITD